MRITRRDESSTTGNGVQGPRVWWSWLTGGLVAAVGAVTVLWWFTTNGLTGADLASARLEALWLGVAIVAVTAFVVLTSIAVRWWIATITFRARADTDSLDHARLKVEALANSLAATEARLSSVAAGGSTAVPAPDTRASEWAADALVRAVELLRSDDVLTRVAALHLLEQVGKTGDDHRQAAVDVLCTHLRLASRAGAGVPAEDAATVLAAALRADQQRTRPLDRIDLRGADLRGARLDDVWLHHVNLRGARLRGATLTNAHLFAADLRDADLTDAVLTDANLTDADLTGTDLSRVADLSGAVLQDVKVSRSDEELVRRLGGIVRRSADRATRLPATDEIPVQVWLSDEDAADEVEAAVRRLLDASGYRVHEEGEVEFGSWFRRFTFRARPYARHLLAEAEHGLRLKLIHAAQADVDSKQGNAVAALVAALENTHSAAIQIGSILLVKQAGVTSVRNLTPAEQAHLSRHPSLLRHPENILARLESRPPDETNHEDVIPAEERP